MHYISVEWCFMKLFQCSDKWAFNVALIHGIFSASVWKTLLGNWEIYEKIKKYFFQPSSGVRF